MNLEQIIKSIIGLFITLTPFILIFWIIPRYYGKKKKFDTEIDRVIYLAKNPISLSAKTVYNIYLFMNRDKLLEELFPIMEEDAWEINGKIFDEISNLEIYKNGDLRRKMGILEGIYFEVVAVSYSFIFKDTYIDKSWGIIQFGDAFEKFDKKKLKYYDLYKYVEELKEDGISSIDMVEILKNKQKRKKGPGPDENIKS